MNTDTVTQPQQIIQACTLCGATDDLTREQLCTDRVACWMRIVVAEYEAGHIDAHAAVNRLLSCYRVAADPMTANLAHCYAKAIEEAEGALHERVALTERGMLAVAR